MNKFPSLNSTTRCFNKLTNVGYENSFYRLSRIDHPPVYNRLGCLDPLRFKQAVQSTGSGCRVGKYPIARELSKITGKSVDSIIMDMNTARIKPIRPRGMFRSRRSFGFRRGPRLPRF